MALVPESLRTKTIQLWVPGDPPEPAGVRADAWGVDDKGDLQHKWYDGKVWSGWENLGQP